jgi:DNA-binding CsgD family transcriptional regulator
LLNDAGESSHALIASAIWSARAALQSESNDRRACTLIVPTAAGPARIEASPAGATGAVAIVINASRPAEPIELPVHWPLTTREREIATLALHGLDSDQIAARVFLSPSTVDWHLWNSYEKLEVNGKSGLFARFFQELVLPAVEPVKHHAEVSESIELWQP